MDSENRLRLAKGGNVRLTLQQAGGTEIPLDDFSSEQTAAVEVLRLLAMGTRGVFRFYRGERCFRREGT